MRALAALSVPVLAACAACQVALPQPVPVTVPPFVMSVPASPAASATALPLPLPQQGLLPPGAQRTFSAQPTHHLALLVGNPTGDVAALALDVSPTGDATPASPNPGPSASPLTAPEPQPTESPAPDDHGFSGLGSYISATSGLAGYGHEPPTRRVLGLEESFWINNGDATLAGDRERPAALRTSTPHAAFYVDDEAASTVADAELARLGDAFERQIRPRLSPVFGEPAVAPGEPIAVVFSPWIGQAPHRKGMMGYFWPRDVLPQGGSGDDLRQHSNHRHVLFLSTALLQEPDVTAFGTLAHEYQHMLMMDGKSRSNGKPHTEETWLDEGFAMLAMDLAGYGAPGGDPFVLGEVGNFRQNPASYSLTDWVHNPNGYSYGLSYLFTRYLVDRFGPGLVAQVQQTPETGVAGLERVLHARGADFPQVFVDWASAAWKSPEGLSPAHLVAPTVPHIRPWGVVPLELDGLADQARALAVTNQAHPLVLLDQPEGGSP